MKRINVIIIVLLLFSSCASFNVGKRKALFEAVLANDYPKVKELVEKGVDVNARNKDGFTALILASQYGHLEVVKLLINSGADVNTHNNEGWTALKFASMKGNLHIVKSLVESGAEINARIKNYTALDLAKERGHSEVEKYLNSEIKKVEYKDPDVRFIPYDTTPSPIGGSKAILKNINYPKGSKSASIEGTVLIHAFVNEKGVVTDCVIIKGIPNTGLDEAAIDALKKTKFTPAKQDNKDVGVWITIPIIFHLN